MIAPANPHEGGELVCEIYIIGSSPRGWGTLVSAVRDVIT